MRVFLAADGYLKKTSREGEFGSSIKILRDRQPLLCKIFYIRDTGSFMVSFFMHSLDVIRLKVYLEGTGI